MKKITEKKTAFTLAEVLITLGVIGVVAALTLPTVMSNIQDRVKKEQVRNFKYKLTQATDKMKSLGLIGAYDSTEAFVNELKKHYKISKICKNDNLRACWPTEKIMTADGEVPVKDIKKGTDLKALALSTGATDTMGIVTADGVSAIMVYSPKCTALEAEKTYTWSTVDGKPETNATTNCISAIFDINGKQKPNRLGSDVRTINSIFGYQILNAQYVDVAGCNALKKKGLVKGCYYEQDYWAGAVKACNNLGLHLPSMQTLANIAGAKYGRTDIGIHTLIMRNDYNAGNETYTGNCVDYYRNHDYSNRFATSDIICVDSLSDASDTSITSLVGNFWSAVEVSDTLAQRRNVNSTDSTWHIYNRNHNYDDSYAPLCVGD